MDNFIIHFILFKLKIYKLLSNHNYPTPFSSLSGNMIEIRTDKINIPPTIPSEMGEEIWYHGEMIILTPMKLRIMASP